MPIQAPQWTEFLTCPICYHQFDVPRDDRKPGEKEKDRLPVSLGCGHTLCQSCLKELLKSPAANVVCPFDQAVVEKDVDKLPINTALLQLVGADISEQQIPDIPDVKEHQSHYLNSKKFIEVLALFLKQLSGNGNGNGHLNGNGNGNGNGGVLSRPMQRKLVTLVNCQLAKEEGRMRAMRAARSLGERTVTELILLHQNQQQLSANLWAAVRARGCQFLGPAMQEEALKYILLALEGGEALSRKVLVLFVVQKLEPVFHQASKTSIGHVVQLLYRASCFTVTKRNEDSSLMQLREQFRTYDALRKEHDAQIVQIATEAGLRISPDQWSSLLYGDLDHKSHMQSIIDKLQSPESFAQSIQELIIALQRSGDPGELSELRSHFELLSRIDAQPEAPAPSWEALEDGMKAVHSAVNGLASFSETYGTSMRGANDPPPPHNTKFKTSLCRDFQRGSCPRGTNCTFAHSEDELERFSRGRRQVRRPQPIARGAGPDQFPPIAPSENGAEGSPSGSSLDGSARGSPLCVSGAGPVNMTEGPPAYGQPQQMYGRKNGQEQLTRGMSQMAIHTPRIVRPEPNYGAPPAASYPERMPLAPPPQGNDRSYYGYYGQSPAVTIPATGPPSQSYAIVHTSREANGVGSGLLSPRCSPLTIQDVDAMVVPHENGLHNGYVDPQLARYQRPRAQYEPIRRRVDREPHLSQPQVNGAAYQYGSPTYANYTDPYRGSGNYYYSNRQTYEPALQYQVTSPLRRQVEVAPYNVFVGGDYSVRDLNRVYASRGGMLPRRPFVPEGSDLKLSESPPDEDADCSALLQNLLSGMKPPRKDTAMSSGSSGVSSGSSMSHSPSASQSSNSSVSPRQDSPYDWQHDADAIWPTENVTLPPPPAIADAPQLWSADNQREMKKLWTPFDDWDSDNKKLVEQIMRDEEIARKLQQELESFSSGHEDMEANDAAIVQAIKNEEEEEEQMLQRRTQDENARLDAAKRQQEKEDCDLAMQTQALEDAEEAERKKKKRKMEEYAILLQERRDLIAKQNREAQEEKDRRLAEQIAFHDAQRHGLVPPNTRQMPIGYNPNVISRGPHVDRPFHGNGADVTDVAEFNSFGGLGCFRTSCASSDDVIDTSKLAPGCSGDIRVQE